MTAWSATSQRPLFSLNRDTLSPLLPNGRWLVQVTRGGGASSGWAVCRRRWGMSRGQGALPHRRAHPAVPEPQQGHAPLHARPAPAPRAPEPQRLQPARKAADGCLQLAEGVALCRAVVRVHYRLRVAVLGRQARPAAVWCGMAWQRGLVGGGGGGGSGGQRRHGGAAALELCARMAGARAAGHAQTRCGPTPPCHAGG